MVFLQSLIIAVILAILFPITRFIYTSLQTLFSPSKNRHPEITEAMPVDQILPKMLEKLQCQTSILGKRDNGRPSAIAFEYQGGHFIATYPDEGEAFENTISISFFSCFACKLEFTSILEHTSNDINSMILPVKSTISTQDGEADSLIINLHSSGVRIIDDARGMQLLKALLGCFFFVQRTISERFDALKEEGPGDIFLNRQPYSAALYAIAHAEIESQPRGWNLPWYEAPDWTVEELINRITGFPPEFDYDLYANGEKVSESQKHRFNPFRGSVQSMLSENYEIQIPVLTLQLIPKSPNADTPASTTLFLSILNIEDRLFQIQVDYARPALPITPFRPKLSPENEPQTRSLYICIHRGGPELYKAEVEFMAQEQQLIDRCLSGEAAYSLYWGRVLFNDHRYLEAEHYLLNAFNLLSKPMQEPEKQSEETCSTFYELCFFLGQTYYQLGRYRDSYFFLDIIVNRNQLRWTQQYVLTMMAANDPRIASTLNNLREMIKNTESDESLDVIRTFINHQQIILDIKNGKTERARQALESILQQNPDDEFALHWLPKIL